MPEPVGRRTILAGATALGITATSAAPAWAQESFTDRRAAPGPQGAYTSRVEGAWRPWDGHIANNTLAVSPEQSLAAVSSSVSDHLVLVDLRTGRRRRTITGYGTPRNIVFSPDGQTFWVSDSTMGVLDRLQVRSGRLDARLPLGAGVFGTALARDGRTLYANNQAAGTVTVVDLHRRRPIAVIQGFSQPRQGIRLAPDGRLLYVTDFAEDHIAKVDTSTLKVLAHLTGFDQVRGLSVSRDGTRLYAASSGNDTVSIVDTRTGATLHRVPSGAAPTARHWRPTRASSSRATWGPAA